MNLYQTQHPFYCGIDLHANQMYACVNDQAGKKHLHRNFKTRQSDKFLADIEPFGNGIVVGCESTFNRPCDSHLVLAGRRLCPA